MMIAIQQLARENNSLKNKISALKQEINEQKLVLEAKVENLSQAKDEMEERLSRIEALILRTEPEIRYTKLVE